VVWRVLGAQYFGVAQRRRRVFVAGHLGGGGAASVLFESTGMFGDFTPGAETKPDPAGTVAACLNSGGNAGGFRTELGEHLIIFDPRYARNGRGKPDTGVPPLKAQNGRI